MHQELRDFYRLYLEMVNSHEFARIGEFFHDTIDFNGTSLTRDDMAAWMRGNIAAVPDLWLTADEPVVEGSRLAVRIIISGTPEQEWLGLAPNGATVTFSETAFYEVEEGRFRSIRNLMDMDSLRAQLLA